MTNGRLPNSDPFTRAEALHLWARLVAGWAQSLDQSGARTLFDGVPNAADAGGSYEGVTRMLWGLGAWFAFHDRAAKIRWRGEAIDLEALTIRALSAGTDPESQGFWGRAPQRSEYDQRTVESGQVAFAAWQSRARIWEKLAPHERANLINWLERFGQQPGAWHSNWALFWALNHAGRKALGERHDQTIIDSALDYLEGVYCGDGWYDDAARRGPGHFDDYNLWVFGTHVAAWALCDGATQPDRRAVLLDRLRAQMAHLPYFFAADGAYTEYGRSLSYKFARLGAPLMAYRVNCWPHSPGLLRRIVGRHIRWYVDRGAVRADGTLRQSLTVGGSRAVRETYISTGATYWAMLAFAGLWALPDDDPFWTAEEEPLPVEQGDFVRSFNRPGWVLVGTQASGAVQRFNAGSTGYYPAKYDKFLYSSTAPFNVGLADGSPAPDSMLCLQELVKQSDSTPHPLPPSHTAGRRGAAFDSGVILASPTKQGEEQEAGARTLAHRHGNEAFRVDEAGCMRMRYVQQIGGGIHRIETVIVPRGEWHVRVHRITLDPAAGPIGAVEGSAPLRFVEGEYPQTHSNPAVGWEYADTSERAVGIMRLQGYDRQFRAAAWRGRHDLNSVFPDYLLPLIGVNRLEPVHTLACLVYTGRPLSETATLNGMVSEVAWDSDGTVIVGWSDGRVDTVPPL